MTLLPKDDRSSLEKARERLYSPSGLPDSRRIRPTTPNSSLPHEWRDASSGFASRIHDRHIRFAGVFFAVAFLFFLLSIAVAGYFLFNGGNAVSADKISIDIQGPTTIAGGDTVPMSLTITNRNPVELSRAMIEIDFPDGTRNADDVREEYSRYSEELGPLAPGASATRSVRSILFAGTGEAVTLEVSLSYSSPGSNSIFVKKVSYVLTISSSPLSVSADTLSETVSGKVFPITLTVRSNAAVSLTNVVLNGTFPFGFSVASSSLPMNDSSFLLGSLSPGATRTIVITGTLDGQDKEQKFFRFKIGTASTPGDTKLSVSYMEQDATVLISAPFIRTALTVNGSTLDSAALAPGGLQSVTLSYGNTLQTNVTNTVVRIAISGAAVDYGSVRVPNGFYDSEKRTVVFSADTDPSLASLAPGAQGIGTFSFSTLPATAITSSPSINFSISISGTRVGQTNVPESVSDSSTYTARVATAVVFSAVSLYASGPIKNLGPLPPHAGGTTGYSVGWTLQNGASAVAGGTVTAKLPSYVAYTGYTSGAGSLQYDSASRVVTWNVGDLAQRASTQAFFQVSITPSATQKGSAPIITGQASFSGYDRFAGVQVSASADPVTTETKGDPGYVSANGTVQ